MKLYSSYQWSDCEREKGEQHTKTSISSLSQAQLHLPPFHLDSRHSRVFLHSKVPKIVSHENHYNGLESHI